MAELVEQIRLWLDEQETLDIAMLAARKRIDKAEVIHQAIRRGVQVLKVMRSDPDDIDAAIGSLDPGQEWNSH
ncbi:MAG: hypothetical protein PHI99_04260 [Syntrophales bacterium]|nr:hypothetical protein [Syntrophales bacterium]